MSEDVAIRETCACGATTVHGGNYLFVADLISKWRRAHAGCAPHSAGAPRGDAVVDAELGEWVKIAREAVWYARVTAQASGYALAVHGSLRRDVDVVAVPWTQAAISRDELAEKIVAWLVTVGLCHEDAWKAASKTREEKPNGRLAWSISLKGPMSLTSRGECAPYLDLSILAPSYVPASATAEMEREAAMWREVEKRASREVRFVGNQGTRFSLHFDGDVKSIAEGLESLGLVPSTPSPTTSEPEV